MNTARWPLRHAALPDNYKNILKCYKNEAFALVIGENIFDVDHIGLSF